MNEKYQEHKIEHKIGCALWAINKTAEDELKKIFEEIKEMLKENETQEDLKY